MYEWLKNYHNLYDEISYLEFNLEQSERELKRWTSGDLWGVKLTEKSDGAKLEDIIQRISNELNHKQSQMNDLMNLVDTFKGMNQRILKLKYVDGMTLEEVAEELGYSASHVKKRHAEIMRTIQFVDDYQEGSQKVHSSNVSKVYTN
ncbi:hypothetical protein BK128_08445 [Viridibacillus sp. FSL H7-0596]|uniref:sigma factor-like helix-turn-helix DNA-binding protein n=1 Tax=Viridibacillus sp. FSL H7-0596 TaxID=1928923 RepID=UPI00096EC71C|nr:sigma factor-like helix-turn-helix DNA-binding protein [Viridibacillus sp. FSL H7-0596]OMC87446.1 hypothetical protein BK128_08445 [Viridibacillus sp. FSL H7-0596]